VNHGTMSVNRSEVNGNTAAASGFPGSGGGILNAEGPPGTGGGILTLDHSRVNHNSAGGNGGGILNGLHVGQIVAAGQLTLKHSEVMDNKAPHGGGKLHARATQTL